MSLRKLLLAGLLFLQLPVRASEPLGASSNIEELIDSLNIRGYNFLSINTDSSEYFTNLALKLSLENKYKKGRCDALFDKAYLYSFRGEYEKTIALAVESLPEVIREQFKELESGYYYLIGDSYQELGYFGRAAEYFLRGLEFDKANGQLEDVIFDYNTMGYLSLEIEDYRQGKRYLDEALRLSARARDTDGYIAGSTYLYLGDYYLRVHQFDSSSYFLDQAEQYLMPHNDAYLLAYITYYRAEILFLSGNIDQAADMYRAALDETKEDDFVDLRTYCLLGLGKTLISKGRSAEGLSVLDEGIELATKAKSLKQLRQLLEQKVEYFRGRGLTEQLISTQQKLNLVLEQFIAAGHQSLGGSIENLEKLFRDEQEIVRASVEISALKASGKRFWLTSGLIFILFSALLGYIYVLYSRARTAVDEIAEKKDKIEAQQKQMTTLLGFQKGITRIISHDMRSPLTNLQVLLELLYENKNSKLDEEGRYMYTRVKQSLEQMNNLLEDLVARLYLEDPFVRSAAEEVDIGSVVEESRLLLLQMVDGKNLTIHANIEPVSICVQPMLLKTVIRNLLFNSIKFSNQGGTIWVSAEVKDGLLNVEIRDNGVGMDEQTMSKIREAGIKTSVEGTFGEKGTGLGLQIVSEILHIFGTSLHVSSEVGKGSTFGFSVAIK